MNCVMCSDTHHLKTRLCIDDLSDSEEINLRNTRKAPPYFSTAPCGSQNVPHFAASCRHCQDPVCVKSCVSGALTTRNGVICMNQNKCVGCFSCRLACPYGAAVQNKRVATLHTGYVLRFSVEGLPV